LVIRSDQDLQLQGKLNLPVQEDIHGLRRKELTQFLLSVSVAAVAQALVLMPVVVVAVPARREWQYKQHWNLKK
jgi:hypothetical protein